VIIIEDYGVSWIVTDPVGGGIVSTGTEPAGEYSATGTITVSEGVTATIRAGAFPWNFATTDRVVSSVTITGEGTVSADYSFPGGGYSTSAITLVGGTGGTSYAFDIFVTYVGTGGGQGGMYIN
jgi:hypothetical protein